MASQVDKLCHIPGLRGTKLADGLDNPRLEKLTRGCPRGFSVYRQIIEAQLRALPKHLNMIVLWWPEGFQGGYTSERCCFFLSG